MAVKIEAWQTITPTTLIAPIEHVRKMFDEGVWKCSQITEKLCFAALHPDDKQVDLGPYKSAFAGYRRIIGPVAAQEFDKDYQVGTPSAIFHAFLQALAAGIRAEIQRLFNDVLQIGIVHSGILKEHPADWAKAHLGILINSNKHVIKLWIKSACDKQDYLRVPKTDQETEDFISWKDWRAPKLIYMQPSGNLPYDPSAVWDREDESISDKLLEGLSDRVILSLGFDLDRFAGDAHVELAKKGRTADTALEDDDRRFAKMAIEEALKSVPEDDRSHPRVGAVVVKDGRVLSRAHRGESPKSHAEYIALEGKLPDDLVSGATVYTTLEPCTTRNHPKLPCAQRLVDRKVARVVIGMLDPNPDIRGLGEQRLNDAGIETQLFPRDLRAQVEEMNRGFIRTQKERQCSTGTRPTKEPVSANTDQGTLPAASEQVTMEILDCVYTREFNGIIVSAEIRNLGAELFQLTDWLFDVPTMDLTLTGGPGNPKLSGRQPWWPQPPFDLEPRKMTRGAVFFPAPQEWREAPPLLPVGSKFAARFFPLLLIEHSAEIQPISRPENSGPTKIADEEAKPSHQIRVQAPLQFYNFDGTPGPVLVSGKQHSEQGPLVDLSCLVTIVNCTQTPIKIDPLSLVVDGREWSVLNLFFRLKSNARDKFARISLLGNHKEDYELHFMFSDDNYPKACSGEVLIQTDNSGDLFSLKVQFP